MRSPPRVHRQPGALLGLDAARLPYILGANTSIHWEGSVVSALQSSGSISSIGQRAEQNFSLSHPSPTSGVFISCYKSDFFLVRLVVAMKILSLGGKSIPGLWHLFWFLIAFFLDLLLRFEEYSFGDKGTQALR